MGTNELKITLTTPLRKVLTDAVATFKKEERCWETYPALSRGELFISAAALPFVLGYCRRISEFDLWRIRAMAQKQIHGRLQGSIDSKAQYYYDTALKNLKGISPGEFLRDGG